MINRVLIIGGGSAGFITAITLKTRLPGLTVTVIRSKEIGIIGVDESSTPILLRHLHGYLRIGLQEFFNGAQPQWKLGIRFLWGSRPWFDFSFDLQLLTQYDNLPKATGFYCGEGPFDYIGLPSGLMTHNKVYARQKDGVPRITTNWAYHLENVTFVSFLERYALQLGVDIIEDTIDHVDRDEHGITGLHLASGQVQDADLYIDSSGFRSLLLSQTLHEPFISFNSSLFNDRAVVGSWPRGDEPIQPYTTAETMNAGWCWRIDHEHHINRGYVYSTAFITDEEAEREFRSRNPKIDSTWKVKFVSGRYERCWVDNVVAIGNASGFVEPLESSALGVICHEAYLLANALADCDREPGPSLRTQFNKSIGFAWDCIRRFLALHFRFNTRLDTPYWRHCRAEADITSAAEFVEYYQENGPSLAFWRTLVDLNDPFGMEGYLSLLVGQQVPYRNTHRPSMNDLGTWAQLRRRVQGAAERGFSAPEMLALIRSPTWTWPANLFQASVI